MPLQVRAAKTCMQSRLPVGGKALSCVITCDATQPHRRIPLHPPNHALTGYYWQRGSAVPCAQGTYKDSIGNRYCDQCPTGFTTQFGTVAATSADACRFVMPGYSANGTSLATANATACPADSYRAGAAAFTNAGVACTPCKANLKTTPGVVGAASESACLVPPGYGWRSAQSDAEICPIGKVRSCYLWGDACMGACTRHQQPL